MVFDVIKGVIFDFNGTMVFDSHIHQAVWVEYIEKLSGHKLTDDEFRHHILGHDTTDILRHFVDKDISEADANYHALEKEAIYRSRCVTNPEYRLVDGLEELLDALKAKNIALNIATGSEISNVRFYFEHFPLTRWFDFDKVVYDNGTFRGKPEPDVYLKAAEQIGVDPRDCVVFEDATSGVVAAHRAGIGQVVAILPGFTKNYFSDFGGVSAVLPDFRSALEVLGL